MPVEGIHPEPVEGIHPEPVEGIHPEPVEGKMTDAETTVAELRAEVHRFADARDWHQFHTPKNLAASIAIEAAELLEHFQWADSLPPDRIEEVVEELADVVIYCLTMANQLNVDLGQAVRQKLVRNDAKYPADKYRGRY